MLEEKIKSVIREVKDFPKDGISFKDITPVFRNPALCADIVGEFQKRIAGTSVDAVVGIESRGFLFGFLLAQKLHVPFILVRKAGKLPYEKIAYEYDLEYGSSKVEMHIGEIKEGWNVLIHDDLLATGGTAKAAAELVKMQQGNIAGFTFVIELNFLNGKKSLKKYSENTISLVNY